jgi:hypothetical protein
LDVAKIKKCDYQGRGKTGQVLFPNILDNVFNKKAHTANNNKIKDDTFNDYFV